jgi:Cu(I)/Ag(I) efflux system protein CusF
MAPSRPWTGAIGHGAGVIKRLDVAGGTLTLHHGPIAAFGWPAMTMTFAARPPQLLRGLKVGQTIAFDARRDGASAQITAIRRP